MEGMKYMLAILFGWAMGLGWNFFIRWYGSRPKPKREKMPGEDGDSGGQEAGDDSEEDREFGDLLVKGLLLILAVIASLLLFALQMQFLLK